MQFHDLKFGVEGPSKREKESERKIARDVENRLEQIADSREGAQILVALGKPSIYLVLRRRPLFGARTIQRKREMKRK